MPKRSLKRRRSKRVRNSMRYKKRGGKVKNVIITPNGEVSCSRSVVLGYNSRHSKKHPLTTDNYCKKVDPIYEGCGMRMFGETLEEVCVFPADINSSSN